MATYTIRGVSRNIREYSSKFGDMKSYKVALDGPDVAPDEPIEISRKASSPAPQAGDSLEGHIEDGQYGKKFKQDYNSGGFSGGTKASGGSKVGDPFAMYLSYAKDIAVAMLDKDHKLDEGQYGLVLAAVIAGGQTLYEGKDKLPQTAVKAPTDTVIQGEAIDFPEDLFA